MTEQAVGQQVESIDTTKLEDRLARLARAREAIADKVFGLRGVVDELLIALLTGGHLLLEGAPGLGKTLLVHTLGEVCGLRFSRIQFTPDLMPSDVTGTLVLVHDDAGRAFTRFQPGPIFAQMVLADEINRATPKTQSALLEAMQERTVTVAGEAHELPSPFFVFATQNPIEMEGTYVLPEAQMDRFFFKVDIPYPSADVLDTILERTTGSHDEPVKQALTPEEIVELQVLTRAVPVASHVRKAVVEFVLATRPEGEGANKEVSRYIRYGVTPRGGQALILAAKARALLSGRFAVSFDDLKRVVLPTLRHRFQLNYEGIADGVSSETLLTGLLERTIARSTR